MRGAQGAVAPEEDSAACVCQCCPISAHMGSEHLVSQRKFPCQNGGSVVSGPLVDSSPSFCVTMKKDLSESHSSAYTNWPENANC